MAEKKLAEKKLDEKKIGQKKKQPKHWPGTLALPCRMQKYLKKLKIMFDISTLEHLF